MGRAQRISMWYDVLERIEKESHCTRNHIGALLLDSDLERLVAYGYNGNFKGGPNTCDRFEPGNCGCIHAEANALTKTRFEVGHSIFVSETPCYNCTKLIINAGICDVYVLRRYRDADKSIALLKSIGIQYVEKECTS